VVANFFFLTFIQFGTMIILNLFVGVIMKGMEEAAVESDMEQDRERTGQTTLSVEQELELLETQLRTLQDGISRARRIAAHASERVQDTSSEG
jgi:voltage-gated sodium channel